MKKPKIVVAITLLLCCFYSSLSVAAWTAPVKILRVQSPPTGSTYFYMDSAVQHTVCPGARFIRLSKNLKNYKEMLASMLMAKALDLDVLVQDTTGTCITGTILRDPYISVQ